MLDQLQSPLFRLPRELRDNIYEHYAHDEKGLFYDYASNKMRYESQNKHQDKNALTRCCKQAAEEMKGVAKRANTLTFLPARSHRDGVEFNNLDSKAGRFERLLQLSRRMKMHILHHVAQDGCVTPTIVDRVAAQFPGISRYYRAVYSAIRHGRDLYAQNSVSRSDHTWRWQTSATLCDAIQYTLDLASSHPAFEDAAARASSSPYMCHGMMPPFLPGSHNIVLAWKPNWWLIPTESDLTLESYLADPSRRDLIGEIDPRSEPMVPVAWYFSATSLAINFLKALPPTDRISHRTTIIIKEDKRGVAYPESHVRGLTPFLLENPHLRVELQVGFWNNLMHPVWLESTKYHRRSQTVIPKENMLRPFADFLDELESFSANGVNSNALKVVIEGQKTESTLLWEVLKHAASLQEALAESDYMKQHHEIDRGLVRYEPDDDETLHDYAMRDRFQLPCDLPPSFHAMVRRITLDESFIHFDGDTGVLWASAKEISVRKAWSPQQFYDEWYGFFGYQCTALPAGGVPAFFAAYELQQLLCGTHPWKWVSSDGSETFQYSPSGLTGQNYIPFVI
ncbi:uncharacterized protein J4E79_006679 [Alternaria viburni]|uniref:uncharacterized protein n=1 Tax=Alternaria viburni TaxID=566460 RepID=UPI0020C2F9CA|nr:uncharacterized protein J4E79_006679 [Alternaria viburni]KAI4658919.1 hypothetical protein J4E79_006679 [Alternaria viburni]